MKKVIDFIKSIIDALVQYGKSFNKFGKVFLFFIALASVATGAVVFSTGKCLNTKYSKWGFVSLVRSSDNAAKTIRDKWNTEKCDVSSQHSRASREGAHSDRSIGETARITLGYDMLFAICYTFFFLSAMTVLQYTQSERTARIHYALAIILFVIDLTENALLYFFLGGMHVPMLLIEVLMIIKFLLFLYLLVGYLLVKTRAIVDFSAYFHDFFGYLWRNRVSVASLLALYFTIWKTDQGQDLLISLSAGGLALYLFYILLLVLAFLNWFLPRYYVDSTYTKAANERKKLNLRKPLFPAYLTGKWTYPRKGKEKDIPRIFGMLTLLIPGFGILKSFDAMGIGYALDFLSPFALLIISSIFLGWLQHINFFRSILGFFSNKNQQLSWKAILIPPIVVIAIISLISPGENVSSMSFVCGDLFVLAIIFLMVTTALDEETSYNWMQQYNAKVVRTILWSGVVVAASFIIINIWPEIVTARFSSRFVTLPVVIGAIVFYSMLFWFLITLGKHWRFNIGALIFFLAVVWAIYRDNNFHDIRRVEATPYDSLESLSDYAKGWVNERRDEIAKFPSETYPVFLVNSYGGGIRAAAWTSMVVTHLEQQTSFKFQEHVFSYSGASGGTIGASVMCALKQSGKGRDFTMDDVREFYGNDFLTPVVIGLIGRDIFLSVIGIPLAEDRSRLQDRLWEDNLSKYDGGTYGREYGSLWARDEAGSRYHVPLLFSNSSHVEGGMKAVLSPVIIDSAIFPQAVDIRKKLGRLSVPFSTGAFLSARFPFLNPAGRLDSISHFLDGGIKENSGAETSYEIYLLLDRLKTRMKADSAWAKIQFYFISLDNSAPAEPSGVSRNLFEFTAPISALYNNGFGYATRADSINRTIFERQGRYMQLYPCLNTVACGSEKKIRPVLPLGWQISDCALKRLAEGVESQCNARYVERIRNLLKVQ